MKSVITTLLLALSTGAFSSNDSLKVIIKLKSVTNVLTFNQTHVLPGALEYLWEIKINSDNNDNTGDANGFDVGLVLENIKYGTSLSYTGTIISGTDQHTTLYNGSSQTYGNQLTSYFNFSDTSIVLVGLSSWPELVNINTGDKIMATTFYNSPTGFQTDTIAALPLCYSSIGDAQGDASSPFIDLISFKINLSTLVGIKKEYKKEPGFTIFPNPGSGIFYIQAYENISHIEVADQYGRVVKTAEAVNELDLRSLSSGVYMVKVITLNGCSFSKKLIKQ